MNDNDTPDWLKAHLDSLPREIAPQHDLWPGIARRLDRPATGRWLPAAVAASVIVSIAAALLSWQVFTRQRDDAALLAAAQSLLQQIQGPYQPVRAGYEAQWPELIARLDPETAAVVEHNLDLIRKANADLVKALEKRPDSPALQGLLRQTLAQELDIYRRVERAAQGSI
jgi:hypothetical protein